MKRTSFYYLFLFNAFDSLGPIFSQSLFIFRTSPLRPSVTLLQMRCCKDWLLKKRGKRKITIKKTLLELKMSHIINELLTIFHINKLFNRVSSLFPSLTGTRFFIFIFIPPPPSTLLKLTKKQCF